MKKIPTIIGLIVLILGAGAGVYLTQATTIFRLKASADKNPQDIKTSNITDNSFVVSWVTDSPTVGAIFWGESESLGKAQTEQTTDLKNTHYITIKDLKPQTTYFYKINSGGADYDNAGIPWQVKTGATLPASTKTDVVSGTITGPDNTPAANVIVYVSADGVGNLSTQTSENGSWVIPLSSARSFDGSMEASLTTDTLLQIFAQGGSLGIATAQIYLVSANPIPAIVLGQTYDLRNIDTSAQNGIPKSSIDVPLASPQPESKITLSEELATPSTAPVAVSIKSIDEGEIVNTTEPEFFGNGPAGAKITITVHSEEIFTDQVTINNSGVWSWNVPSNLSPGEHSITISWTDAGGILRQLTRSFIVSAAEGPAFESSPSGSTSTPVPTIKPTTSPSPTIKPTATAKPSPSPSASPRLSIPATDSAIPVSGSLTPTLTLSIIGIVLFSFGLWTLIRQPNK